MNLHSIKFAIEVDARLIDPDRGHVASVTGHKVLDWSTGLGPCGRWVHRLNAEIDMATIRITQESYSRDRSKDLEKVIISTLAASPYRTTMAEVVRLNRELADDCKVETFIYKLEDVRGRIKAVERRGR
ncbi:hypothetical protein [Pseudomonas phage Pf17397_F_PD1]|nr:hypothetical protein [Pseudomonas phage Pf17397_F_PD1]